MAAIGEAGIQPLRAARTVSLVTSSNVIISSREVEAGEEGGVARVAADGVEDRIALHQ